MLDTNFYKLKLKNIQAETSYAVVLTLEVPNELKDKFQYQAGQYLTVRFTLNGKEQRRAYSLCSSPVLDKDLKIGIKRVDKGLVSNHINQNLKVGDEIEVMCPQGTFTPHLDTTQKKDYFLFAGGSGITPMLSILKTIAENEPKSRVALYYANRNEESIMFQAELEQMEQRYKDQIFVKHILDQPKTEKKGGIFGLFAKKVTQWTGDTGLVSVEKVNKFINQYKAEDQRPAEYFLCGPSGMMDIVRNTLLRMGVEEQNVHQEWFASDSKAEGTTAATEGKQVIVTLNGKKMTVVLNNKETILEALIRLKANPPFSCMSGACSTCMAKVVQGEVKMERCLALEKDEIAKGYILTCSSIPTTDVVEITYDV